MYSIQKPKAKQQQKIEYHQTQNIVKSFVPIYFDDISKSNRVKNKENDKWIKTWPESIYRFRYRQSFGYVVNNQKLIGGTRCHNQPSNRSMAGKRENSTQKFLHKRISINAVCQSVNSCLALALILIHFHYWQYLTNHFFCAPNS